MKYNYEETTGTPHWKERDFLPGRQLPPNRAFAEEIAEAFHYVYEEIAPIYNHKTRAASCKPWDRVPEKNRKLMIKVVEILITQGVIVVGPAIK